MNKTLSQNTHKNHIKKDLLASHMNRQNSQRHVVNLAPLIDVVFILLAFLLVYSRIDNSQSINVDLPQVGGNSSAGNTESIISIDSLGEIYLDTTPLSKEDLEDYIRNTPKEHLLQIKADKNAPSETLIFVMKSLSKYNRQAVEIMVDNPL